MFQPSWSRVDHSPQRKFAAQAIDVRVPGGGLGKLVGDLGRFYGVAAGVRLGGVGGVGDLVGTVGCWGSSGVMISPDYQDVIGCEVIVVDSICPSNRSSPYTLQKLIWPRGWWYLRFGDDRLGRNYGLDVVRC